MLCKSAAAYHWHNLRVQVHGINLELQNYNEGNQKVQSLPEQFVKKFIDIFNAEIDRQNKGLRKTFYAKTIESFAEFIYYDQAKYIDAFNAILYN